MIKKTGLIFSATLLLLVSQSTKADLFWAFGGDLATFDATITDGWIVRMYQDVNNDTSVGSISSFSLTGLPTGGFSTDDLLIDSDPVFTQSISTGKGGQQWGVFILADDWASLTSDYVYSVIYNSSNVSSATEARVVDASPFQLPSSDPGTYSPTTLNNDWVAVPEPGTMALMMMGVAGLFGLRKRITA